MSFHFEHNEPLAEGARRVVSEQIDIARTQLRSQASEWNQVVHEMRKCFKRIRATLHLVDFERTDTFEKESRRYRKLGRLLANQRDCEVLVATFDKLIRDYRKHLEGLTLERERMFIIRHAKSTIAAEDIDHLKSRLERELEEAHQAVAGWHFKQAASAPVTSIVPSVVRKTYSRATDNFLAICQNPTPEKMHNWRKRVKDLFYQSQLLDKTDMKFSPTYGTALEQLADLLGQHHDLAVLYEAVARHGPHAPENLAVEGLVELIAMAQSRLENQARETGGKLFYEKPAEFIQHLGWV